MDRQTAIDLILDHYEHPRHYGALADATFSAEGFNAGCGDVVRLYVRLDERDIISAVSFEGQGCTISQAAASVLTELLVGKPLGGALMLDEEALAEMLGREVVANRMPCFSLALRVFKTGAQRYAEGRG